jgi:SAM-dependent methyltransferase
MEQSTPFIFDGSIPKNYDRYLAPFLFEPYARDLVGRIEFTAGLNILELACGTGIVTRHLAEQLPASAELTTTDINADMLGFAQDKLAAPNILWDTVDMAAIPYADELFDIVVCQFGLMFTPDKSKAVSEIRRVLRKDGKLLFNVWANLADNPIWRINATLISRFFPNAPLRTELGPFSIADEHFGLSLLQQAGFTRYEVESVRTTGVCDTATTAANGFTLGTPLYHSVKDDPNLLENFRNALEEAIISELGNSPVRSPLRAWVFTAVK